MLSFTTPLIIGLAILAPLTGALNAPTPTGNSTYSITSYRRNCEVPGDCHYAFNVVGVETLPAGPSFSTFCSGIEEVLYSGLEGQWVDCYNDTSVSTFQEYQAGRGVIHLEVRHRWDNVSDLLSWTSVGRFEWPIGETDNITNFSIEAAQKGSKNLL